MQSTMSSESHLNRKLYRFFFNMRCHTQIQDQFKQFKQTLAHTERTTELTALENHMKCR